MMNKFLILKDNLTKTKRQENPIKALMKNSLAGRRKKYKLKLISLRNRKQKLKKHTRVNFKSSMKNKIWLDMLSGLKKSLTNLRLMKTEKNVKKKEKKISNSKKQKPKFQKMTKILMLQKSNFARC